MFRLFMVSLLVSTPTFASKLEFQCRGNPPEDFATKPLDWTFTYDLSDSSIALSIEDLEGLGFQNEGYHFISANDLGKVSLQSVGSTWYQIKGTFVSKNHRNLKDKIDISFFKNTGENTYRTSPTHHTFVLDDGSYRQCRDENMCGQHLISYYLNIANTPEGRLAEERKKRMHLSTCTLKTK